MDTVVLFEQIAISILLGLLVGLQRERSESDIAGVRTFPLITVFGTICSILASEFGFGWIVGAGLMGIVGLIFVGNIPKLRQEEPDLGVTTEIAMLVMFAVGAFLVVGPWDVAVAVTCAVAVLLHYKPLLHGFAKRMGDEDFRAILQFMLISFIVLPVLQKYDRNYDPMAAIQQFFPGIELVKLDVLNPYEVWLMVVLVVSISLGGYVTYKLFGRRAGIVLGGILGGMISSTATTVSYSRRTANAPDAAGMSAVVLMIATSIVFIRVLIEISVAAPSFLSIAAGPVLVMFAASIFLAGLVWMTQSHDGAEMPAQENPTELKSALMFGLLYAAVIIAVAVAREMSAGNAASYAVAGISGMTDMDAITLSTSRLVNADRLSPTTGWRLIVVATMSNLVFKGMIVAAIGHRNLLKRMSLLFGALIVVGAGVLALWP